MKRAPAAVPAALLALLLGASAPGLAAEVPTLAQGLARARADRAGDPEAAAAFGRLAKEFGTPLYVYDRASIESQAGALKEAFSKRFGKLRLLYALKANTNATVIALLKRQGFGAEVVSEGEIDAAIRCGYRGEEVMFTSSSKSPSELRTAVARDVVLNVDSLDELARADAEALRQGRKVRVSFRINPGVDPHTIHQINTGISESKFGLHLEGGIAFSAYERALKLPNVVPVGAHCHIGSQITETEGYELTARKMLAFLGELKEKLGLSLEFLDLGGGLGIPYRDGETVMTPEDLAKALEPIWKEGTKAMGYEPTLWLEPGRFLVAPSGYLLVRVNTVKTTPVKTFVNVDAGFNTLVRPAMYQAYHRVRAVGRTGEPLTVDVAGDVCETGDILAEARALPKVAAGDLLVFLDAGAYGYAMASEYNARPLPAEVLVDGDRSTLIRARGTFDDLHRGEAAPATVLGR